MRRVVVTVLLVVALSAAGADELAQVIGTARTVNATFLAMTLDLELAELRYRQSIITASDELDRLSAEAGLAAARAASGQSRETFLRSVVDAIYAVLIADRELEVARLEETIAREEARVTETQTDQGLAPQHELASARVAVQSAAVTLERARWEREDAAAGFTSATGVAVDEVTQPALPQFDVTIAAEDAVAADPAVARARANERIAEIRIERLARNAPEFDRTLAQSELQRARQATENAIRASRTAYDATVRSILTQRRIIRMRQEEVSLNESFLADAGRRYDRGIASVSERDQAAVRLLNARIGLLQAEQAYLHATMRYVVIAQIPPEELL